ncbi:MAG: hypothetical protein HUU60_04645 [Armatimonadetes bacterium]|nr:hypothetical protein [Armatimonadota bacterium]
MQKRLWSCAVLLAVSTMVFAQDETIIHGPSEIVTPVFRSMKNISQAHLADNRLELPKFAQRYVHKPKGKDDAPGTDSEGPYAIDESVFGGTIQAYTLGRGFAGPAPNEWTPPDPDMAVGRNHVIGVNNDDIVIYTKNGQQLSSVDANTLFNSNDFIFDSWCAYDPWWDRFLVLFARQQSPQSSWELAVSRTGNPMDGWWVYRINARLRAGQDIAQWPDYEKLGFNKDVLALHGNMYQFGGGFLGSQITLLNKAQIYNGQASTRYDVFYSGLGTLHPAEMFTMPDGQEALFLCAVGGGNQMRVRKIINPSQFWANGTEPTFESNNVAIPNYASSPGGRQPGTTTRISNIDSRLLNATYAHGVMTTGHSVARDWGDGLGSRAAARIYRMTVAVGQTPSVTTVTYGAPGMDYYFPAMQVNRDKDILFIMGRSSDSPATFAEVAVSAWRNGQPNPESATPVALGNSAYGGNRWGDYFGVGLDPTDMRTVWGVGQRATGGNWSAWIQEWRYSVRPGDVDLNGCVDDTDLAAVLAAFGLNSPLHPADLNTDGRIDDDDLAIVLSNFGAGC